MDLIDKESALETRITPFLHRVWITPDSAVLSDFFKLQGRDMVDSMAHKVRCFMSFVGCVLVFSAFRGSIDIQIILEQNKNVRLYFGKGCNALEIPFWKWFLYEI
jgi:hypothetical protein